MKKLWIFCCLMLVMTFAVTNSQGAFAATTDSEFEAYLNEQGFPESYKDDLRALHKKHPKWVFNSFHTGLKWNDVVANEYGANNVIYSNGKWVTATKTQLKKYLDPRNFLTEKVIFQFKDLTYNENESKAGVEAILKGTWMYNSKISYLNSDGKTKNIDKLYSASIISGAKKAKLSPFYVASKVVQEVGGSKPTATGVKGNAADYKGLYNYFSIGANNTASDGLYWAMGSPKTKAKVVLLKSASSSATVMVTVPKGTKVIILDTISSGKYHKVKVKVSNKTYTGYMSASKVTASASYGRPWTSPYLSIYNGPSYIAKQFNGQTTGYLQKFNVNSATGKLYLNQYMTNVEGAALEGTKVYKAYNSAGLLDSALVFSIPVYEDMPNDNGNPGTTALKASSYTKNSVTLSWPKLGYSDGYRLYRYDPSTKKYKTLKTITGAGTVKYTDKNLTQGAEYRYKIKGYKKTSSGTVWGSYSKAFYAVTKIPAPKSLKVTVTTKSYITMKWSAVSGADGYKVYRYDAKTKKYVAVAAVNSKTLTYSDKKLTSGTSYKHKVRAYVKASSGTKYYGEYSVVSTAKTEGKAPSSSSATTPTTKPTTPTQTPTPSTSTVYLKGKVKSSESLNMRSGAGTSYAVLVKIPSGTTVTILKNSGDWYQVKAAVSGKSYKGYVSKEYITVTSQSGSVTASSLKIRSGAGTSYSTLATLTKGATVTVTDLKGSWYKIKATVGGKSYKGYVSAEYIKLK